MSIISKPQSLAELLQAIRACQLCAEHLPLGPNPIVRVSSTARLLIVGQAPGIRVHQTGIPWNDPSGDRLREWLSIDREQFYNVAKIAIIPMGYCYPGTGPSGDLPPRRECAQHWLEALLAQLPHRQLTLLIGQYAQQHYLKERRKSNLTATVKAFAEYGPTYFPLPHPSPRNNIWLRRNPWFNNTVVPALRARVRKLFAE